MSSLVTGGTGFLGRYVVGALMANNEPVIVLSRRPIDEAPCIVGDLTAPLLELSATSCEVVYHIAGRAHVVPRTEAGKERFFQVNAEGTRRLLHALEHTARRLQAVVLVSTVAVYGREAGELLDEGTPRQAEDPYGLSKRIAEDILVAWGKQNGVRTGIVRLPLVAGRGAPGNLGAMIQAIAQGRYLNVGGGLARRSIVLASDVAAILPMVARAGGVYHLTDGVHPSFANLSAALAEALGKKPPRSLPLPLASLGAYLGDALQATTGWRIPLTRRALQKMTSTLTFSDEKARQKLGWNPSKVLEHAAEFVQ